MNKIYKVIWNTQLGCWQAVSELAKNHSSSQSTTTTAKKESHLVHKVSQLILFGMALLPLSIHAAISNVELPTGAQINTGSASFNQNNNTLNINQNSQNLSTNWNSFNIGKDATVNFNQPNQSSTAINHVLDSNASQIMGRLNANGQVFLLNPNGVVFSKTAQVNVGGLVASTLNLNDTDIQNGKYTLKGDANSTATIENHGTINTLSGGTVALIAPNVKNTGTITTPNGTTHLTSASQVTLALQDGSLTQYQVDQGVLQGLVDNGGAIIADNGAVYLTAKAKDSLSKAVVNHTGVIEANRLTQNAKGEIILLGDMQSGETNVTGTLKAEGKNGADGGFIETSAANIQIQNGTKVSTLSDNGKTGTWLIDPTNFTIGTGSAALSTSGIGATTLQNNLANNNVSLETASAGTEKGDINVNADVTWSSANSLTLKAHNDINLNKKINAQNGGLTLNAANNISAKDAINVGTFTLTSGNWLQNSANLPGFYANDFNISHWAKFLRVLGGDGTQGNPWLLKDIYGLQGIQFDVFQATGSSFKLANNIDAIGTEKWRMGSGFDPIGYAASRVIDGKNVNMYFKGIFDGSDYTISNLTVNNGYYSGLFGATEGATIKNIHLNSGVITGSSQVGGLVGYMTRGSIQNSSSSAKVNLNTSGMNVRVGGLVGTNYYGNIESSFSTGTVNGVSTAVIENGVERIYAGGLVGLNLGNIRNSYATGLVSGASTYGVVTGGLVGLHSNGEILASYATGNVSANRDASAVGQVHAYAGGLAGWVTGGWVSDSYATGASSAQVNSYVNVGGLVGRMMGFVSNSYALGKVSITNGKQGADGNGNQYSNIGGLVGIDRWTDYNGNTTSGSITNSFWNKETTGQSTSAGGTGLSTAEMFNKNKFTGFDFSSIWGNGNNQTTPYLLNMANNQVFNKNDVPTAITSTNRPALYTAILNVNQLQNMNQDLSGKYLLGNNIDASDTVNWNSGAGFNPIGNSSINFLGKMDGLGHIISDLNINLVSSGLLKDIGLFGYIGSLAKVSNFGLLNININLNNTGNIMYGNTFNVGALAGQNEGTIFAVYSTGKVNVKNETGISYNIASQTNVGGLIGSTVNTSQLNNVYSTADVVSFAQTNSANVDATAYAGGLIGYQRAGKISNAYAKGTVESRNSTNKGGASYAGGLVGAIDTGSIENSYSTSVVNANTYASNRGSRYNGGIVGASSTPGGGTVKNSYWNDNRLKAIGNEGIQATNSTSLTDTQMMQKDSFSGFNIDDQGGTGAIWRIYEGQTTPLLRSFLTQATINPTNKTVTYNGQTQSLGTANFAGLDNSKIYSSQSSSKNVGDYSLQYYSNQQGYDLMGNTVTLRINKAALTITANDKNKTYGDTTTFTGTEFSASGLQNGEAVGSVNLSSAGKLATAGVNGGIPYAITAGSATGGTFDANNYTITYVSGKLIVAPRSLTITVNDKNKTYGDTTTFAGTEFTSSGLQNGETVGNVNLSSAGASATAGVNGGTPYTITAGSATGGTFDANNYTISYSDGNLIVTPRSLTIIANNTTKTYGNAMTFTGTEFTVSGLQNGETVGNVNLSSAGASATAGVNGGTPYAITAGGATGGTFDANNYTISYSNGNLIVTPRSLTITANNKNKTYGDTTTFTGTEFSASGLQNGETVGNVNLSSAGASATAGVNGGTPYAITASNATGGTFDANNYTISYSNGKLIVSKKDITVTANGGTSTYGDNPLNPNFTASGLVNGETESVLTGLNSSFGISNTTNAGNHTLTVDGTLSNGNYNITQRNDGTWVVAKKDITVTANGGTSTYGDNPLNPNFTAKGLVNGETESVLAGLNNSFGIKNTSNAGSYTLSVDGTLTNGNYNITQRNNGTWVVAKKDITVTANGGTSTYGDNPLNPNFSANGLVNGETTTVLTGLNNSFGINNTSNAGSYTLSVDGTLTNGNYNITQRNDGTWIVGKKDITVTANGGTSTYGENPLNPNLSALGLVNGETETVLAGLNNSFGINNATNAGSYTLTVDGTLTNGNYNITQRNDGTWMVAKKDIIVTANGGTSTYGDNPLNPNLSASGLVNGETESVLTGLNNSFDINNATNAGSYTLTVDGTLTNGNYNITQRNDGTWVVAKKDIIVTANGGSSIYGDNNQVNPNFSANGLVNGETESVLTGLNNSFSINNTSNAGSYTLTVDGTLTNGNYNIIQRNDGIWVIAKAQATVTANGLNTVYNGKDQTVSGFTASGLVNGETEAVLTGVTASVTGKNAGNYTNTASGTDQNYDLTFVDGKLDIAKAQATVTANGLNTVYNGKDQTVSGFTASGLVNGETEAVLTGVTASVTGKDAGNYTNTASGTDKNYELKFVDGSLSIAKAKITQVKGITANDRVYDATRDATLNTNTAQFDGIVAGDELTVATATGQFNDKNVGTAKNVVINNISLSGADVRNYELVNTTAQTTVNISKANINAITGITANNRIYDGLTDVSLNLGNAQFNGLYAGDQLTVATATGQFDSTATGQGKTVAITGLSLGGTDALNYNLVDTTASTQADIYMLTPAAYLQAIQFNRPSYLPKENSSRNITEIEVRQGGVNTTGIQTLVGEH